MCHEGILCSEIERGFFVKKRAIYVIYKISDCKERHEKYGQ